jgi:hypothetical protein
MMIILTLHLYIYEKCNLLSVLSVPFQEIIGGMLDLDHSLWRKPRREDFDLQRKKVLQFAEWWKMYDFTVRKEKDTSASEHSD